MNVADSWHARRRLADRLQEQGDLASPLWRAAVEAVPREAFLSAGVFVPEDGATTSRWRPVVPGGVPPDAWWELVYRDESLVTQLDNHLTPDRAGPSVTGAPTSSSTRPGTVVRMLEALDVPADATVLEIGTGTGYSTALLCHALGEDRVTSVEVDPEVAARADASLEACGFSTWTVTGDGLLGHPARAPYARIIATCATRRIPYAWIRQAAPGGTVLATVGSWSYGTGLAKVTVRGDGTAEGRILGRSSFMPARAQAPAPLAGDLAARAAYADSVRAARVPPDLLRAWMPAFLAQLAAPGARLVNAVSDGRRTLYLLDPDRESFAQLVQLVQLVQPVQPIEPVEPVPSIADGVGWSVRQGGPVALWDEVESALIAWQREGEPDLDSVRLRVTPESHTYWIGDNPALRWDHRLTHAAPRPPAG